MKVCSRLLEYILEKVEIGDCMWILGSEAAVEGRDALRSSARFLLTEYSCGALYREIRLCPALGSCATDVLCSPAGSVTNSPRRSRGVGGVPSGSVALTGLLTFPEAARKGRRGSTSAGETG